MTTSPELPKSHDNVQTSQSVKAPGFLRMELQRESLPHLSFLCSPVNFCAPPQTLCSHLSLLLGFNQVPSKLTQIPHCLLRHRKWAGGVGKNQRGCGCVSCMGAHIWKAPRVPSLLSDLKTLDRVPWVPNKVSQKKKKMFVFYPGL